MSGQIQSVPWGKSAFGGKMLIIVLFCLFSACAFPQNIISTLGEGGSFIIENDKPDSRKMKEEPAAGFIAQELDEAQRTSDAEWLNLVLKDNPEKLEATPGKSSPDNG